MRHAGLLPAHAMRPRVEPELNDPQLDLGAPQSAARQTESALQGGDHPASGMPR
jgi:hypothetical protein